MSENFPLWNRALVLNQGIVLKNLVDEANSRAIQNLNLGDTYASIDHDHDLDYSALNHNHDSAYAPIGHDHDSDYAPVDHDHDLDHSTTHAVQSSVATSGAVVDTLEYEYFTVRNGPGEHTDNRMLITFQWADLNFTATATNSLNINIPATPNFRPPAHVIRNPCATASAGSEFAGRCSVQDFGDGSIGISFTRDAGQSFADTTVCELHGGSISWLAAPPV
jgi:hypothetical protein